MARASIEIHESARSALNALLNDLTAAEFSAYDNGVQGYFALSQGPTDPVTGAYSPSPAPVPANANWRGAWSGTTAYAVLDCVSNGGSSYICIVNNTGQLPPTNPASWSALPTDTLTFTTLAPQPASRYAAPEAVEQLALVRYALEWDGGSAVVGTARTARPTFNLVKRVRFPATSDPNLNMDIFNWDLVNTVTNLPFLQSEFALPNPLPSTSNDPDVILDIEGLRYAQSEVIAFHVLSMNVRLFCLPRKQPPQPNEPSEAFVETGFGVGSAGPTLTDLAVPTAKTWNPPNEFANFLLRIFTGNDAGDASVIPANPPTNPLGPITGANTNDTLVCIGAWTTATPGPNSQYRVESDLATIFGAANPAPAWYQRVSGAGNYNFFGPTYRPPALVEVTLEMTDVHATSSFVFTQKFYIPASER